jgi:hypothetical protein
VTDFVGTQSTDTLLVEEVMWRRYYMLFELPATHCRFQRTASLRHSDACDKALEKLFSFSLLRFLTYSFKNYIRYVAEHFSK